MPIQAAQARHAHWGLVTANGALILLGGLFLCIFPFAGALVSTAVIGGFLVLAGVMGFFAALRALADGRGSVLAFVGPPLAMFAGAFLWLSPAEGLESLMAFAGAFTLVAGLFQLAAAFGLAGREHWGLLLINALLTLAAGACILMAPGIAVLVFTIFFGVQLLFHGGHLMRVGLRMRRMLA
jgi:uncharacterized membrane protein HdeD (DUF308 family)